MRDNWGYEVFRCPSCGVQILPEQKYCMECGELIIRNQNFEKDEGIKMAKLELEIDFKKLGEELAKHDFVEVVRCKDCENWRPIGDGVFGSCSSCDGIHDMNWYCADGERREERGMSKESEWIIGIRDGIPHLTDRKELIRCKDCTHWDEATVKSKRTIAVTERGGANESTMCNLQE